MAFFLRLETTGTKEASDLLTRVAKDADKPVTPILDQIAQDWRDRVLPENLDRQQTVFVPLSPAAKEIREHVYGPSKRDGPILVRDGTLKDSLQIIVSSDTEIAVGSRHFLARLHEFGYTTAPGSAIPGKSVPARPWIHLAAEEIEKVFERLRKFWFGK